MAVHFLSANEILHQITKGKAFLLVEPLFDDRSNLLLGTEKILTSKDLEKVQSRYPEVFMKPLHVRTTIPHFISEEQRIKWVAYLISLFREDDFYRDLAKSPKDFISKYLKANLLENDYVIWKLSQIKNFSKKVFKHSVHTCFVSLTIYYIYNQNHFQGMINAHQVGSLISAALLHDVGFMQMNKGDVEKKRVELLESEYLKYYQHAIYSYQILEAEKARHELDKEVMEAVLNHEERIDGSGLPRGLDGESLSFISQIVALADYFSQLTLGEWTLKQRPYREHIAKLRKEKTRFNPDLVAALDLAFKYLFKI